MLGEDLNSDLLMPDTSLENSVFSSERGAGTKRHDRILVTLDVELRPSSSSQRLSEQVLGTLSNFSVTGCGGVFSMAPRVGDVYRLVATNDASCSLDGTHIRCTRCQFLDEDAFEAGFRFLTRPDLRSIQQDSRLGSDVLNSDA